MKIAYFVHGRGRGHAVRTLSVVPQLIKTGHEVNIYAGGMASSVLGNDSIKITSVMPGLKGIKTLFERIKTDKNIFSTNRPDFVISDGDAPCLYAAKKLNIPSIAIGHGIIIPYFHHTISFPFFRYLTESINVWVSSNPADIKIGVHFDYLKPKKSDTYLAQPSIPEIKIGKPEDYIISYFRDSNGTKVVNELIKKGIEVHNFGEKIDGAINHPYNQTVFREHFGHCAGVVASAGFNLVSEALHYQKPMLAMYKKGDFEQWMNATYLAKIKGYTASSFEKLNSRTIDQFMEDLKTNTQENEKAIKLPYLTDLLTHKIIPALISK